MFATLRNPAKAYATVGVETGVIAADPHKLILMLFDGALMTISSASRHIERKDTAEKGKAISRAIGIISDGLMASLDMRVGGDLAQKLSALYEYMCTRLLYANLHDSKEALDEVSRLLVEIRGAWEEIGKKPALHSETLAAA